jgi:hypothetical protein
MFRNLTTLLITLAAAFGVGVWVGQHPNEWPEKLNFRSTQIKILVSDSQFLPTDWKTWEAKVRVKIELIEAKNFDKFNDLTDSVDLIFATQDWLRMSHAKGYRINGSTTVEQLVNQNISADFLTTQARENNWIPYWWTLDKDRLVVFSWVLRRSSKARYKKSVDLLEFLLNKNVVLNWLDDVPFKTTFSSLETSSITEEKKASQVRKIKFPAKN